MPRCELSGSPPFVYGWQAGSLNVEYNNFDFFIFVFSGILFDLILVHIPMLKWYIYSMATSCYVHYVESMLIQTPWWISLSRIISTCFCIGFGFHYLSKTRLLDHKFYVVKLTLNPKVHNNLPKFGWGNASFIYPRRRPTNFCSN